MFGNVGVTNGAEGLSTMVNPVATPFLSCKPPSLPSKVIVKGKFLTISGQLRELIGEHCWARVGRQAIVKINKAKQNFRIKPDRRFLKKEGDNLITICPLMGLAIALDRML